jgi:hypothetical protein
MLTAELAPASPLAPPLAAAGAQGLAATPASPLAASVLAAGALVFADAPAACLAAPLPATATGGLAADDPAARAILCRAQGMFQKWPEGFAGFRARFCCETSNGMVQGRLAVGPPDRVEVDCAHARLRLWLSGTLRAIASQRTPRFFDQGDGRFPISFADHAPDEAGRAIDVHGRLGRLRYWIDGRGRISRVERIARGLRAVTTFDELVRATPGRVLPATTTTSMWDVATGGLLHSASAHDAHRRVEHVWLPASRRISGRLGAGEPAIAVTFEDHHIL